MKVNITKIVMDNLCNGCGTCMALCPREAISINRNTKEGIYIPVVDDTECNSCGLCLTVCSGKGVDYIKLRNLSYESSLIGNYINCYMGFSTNENIRYNAASGGLITGLLKYTLEEGLIDGAITTRFKTGQFLEPEPFIARTIEEILDSRGSKYCPVSVNTCLKDIMNDGNNAERYAVVGTPCHINGLSKADIVKKELVNKIPYRFGLFCHHGVSFRGTEFLLNKFGISKQKIRHFQYRGNGWPGGINIELDNGRIFKSLLPEYWGSIFSLYYFTPKACMLCGDALCELADLSFGDAWLPELNSDNLGSSIIISRTRKGEELLLRAYKAGAIYLIPLSLEKVIEAQHSVIYFKKRGLSARIAIAKYLNQVVPEDNRKPIDKNIVDYILALAFMNLNNYISRSSFGIKVLRLMPLKILKLYSLAMYKFFFNKRTLL